MTSLRGAAPASLWPRLAALAALAVVAVLAACGDDAPPPMCTTSDDCAAGEACQDGRCVVAAADSGAADGDTGAPMCAPAETLCGDVCADTRSDPAHCGGCAMDCGDPPGSTVVCMNSLCVASCDEGFADCDGDETNGCETDLATDDANCGACGAACSGGSCAASSCLVDPRGDGSDGSFVVDAGEAVLNSILTTANGGMGRTEVILTDPAGFEAGQMLLLQQSQGPGAGRFSLHRIVGVAAEVVTVNPPLGAPYATGAGAVAQAIVVPQYTDLTVTGGRVVAPSWDGTTGGIIALAATGTVTVGAAGSIDVVGLGFRGGPVMGPSGNSPGRQGEGDRATGELMSTANGSGGGGGGISPCNRSAGGGGGAGSEPGAPGGAVCTASPEGGVVAGGDGSLIFGGAGGQGGAVYHRGGGSGGGAVVVFASRVEVEGTILAGGAVGQGARRLFTTICSGAGGGGAGGTIYLDTDEAVLGEALVTAAGGAGGSATGSGCDGLVGGAGGAGRVSVRADTITGTTEPPAITP